MDTEHGVEASGGGTHPLLRNDKAQDDAASVANIRLPERYSRPSEIARGGFGIVLRADDEILRRTVAMKILHPRAAADPEMRSRFLLETEVTAQLQHPGIVKIFTRGELEDGRPWYTMEEVRGINLADAIDDVHSVFADPQWTMRRLIDALARAAQAVGYAHKRGVVHRDLKPANIMLGEFGEVLVMDWGLARRMNGKGAAPDSLRSFARVAAVLDQAVDPLEPVHTSQEELTTRGVLGTPAYMSPEQALGAWDKHGPASDVFSLGANLYHLLAGRPPYPGNAQSAHRQAIAADPASLRDRVNDADGELDGLMGICERAMQKRPKDRFADAQDMARAILGWLDGARRRERAETVLFSARSLKRTVQTLRDKSESVMGDAIRVGRNIQPHTPLAEKEAFWRLEDSAKRYRREAAVVEARWLEKIHGALNLDPRCKDARRDLGEFYRGRLLVAERLREVERAAHYETLLESYASRGFIESVNRDGLITLLTNPDGAEVIVERYELIDRKLVATEMGTLGRTPLRRIALDAGSYRLRLRAPGRREVLLPVVIERGQHWDNTAPGDSRPRSIWMPREGELQSDDVYVPAGWCQIGGDYQALDSLPARRVWVDGFVVQRFPVTNEQFDAFVAQLADDEAHGDRETLQSSLGLGFGAAETAESATNQPASERHPQHPVVSVTWHAASRYAEWLASRTGNAWRLPHGVEREKAARGVDGRRCPWGDHMDAAFTVMADSHTGTPRTVPVDQVRADVSPYGVVGLAGNSRDWCANAWSRGGPAFADGSLELFKDSEGDYRVVRGGAWMSTTLLCLSANRFALKPELRRLSTGIRLVRSIFPARE